MKTKPLDHLNGSCGAQVPLESKDQAQGLVEKVLLPDAIKTLSRMYPKKDRLIIEIRGKICRHHPYFSKNLIQYGSPCPDHHKGRSCCGIAWLYFDVHGQDSDIPDESQLDFKVQFRPAGKGVYYPLARISIELGESRRI